MTSGAAYAFVYSGSDNWQKSHIDDWNFKTVELTGTEKHLGYRKFDGAICRVLKTADGNLIAITKN